MLKSLYLLVFVFLFSLPAFAMTLDLGIAANENSMLISNQDLTDVAEVNSDMTFYPTVSLKSDHAHFDNSNWGYFYEFAASTFYLNKQGDPEPVNMGTALEGYYAHFTPTLFYSFGDEDDRDFNTQVGIGVGLGYLDIHGDFLTDKLPPVTTQNVNSSGLGFSVGVYFEAEAGNWITRINGYGPVVDIGAYTYQYIDVTMSLSYRFRFDL